MNALPEGIPLLRTPGRVVMTAPAKVNLHLEVLQRRPDGYHEIETVLQAVKIFDTVSVTLRKRRPGGAPRIALKVRPAGKAPEDSGNLCWQAVRSFCQATGTSGDFLVDLRKEIPAAAGLGGGSSDAAATLVACNLLLGTGLERPQLEELAADIGSDAPFFIRGGTVLGRGRGTRLTDLPKIRQGHFLIIKPDLDLLTSRIYGSLKMGLTVRSPKANIPNMKPLIARFPTSSWFGFNRLEDVVLPALPELQRLILRLRELAPVAMLSGSGSAIFAVFPEGRELSAAIEEFAHVSSFVRVVGPHVVGVEIKDAS